MTSRSIRLAAAGLAAGAVVSLAPRATLAGDKTDKVVFPQGSEQFNIRNRKARAMPQGASWPSTTSSTSGAPCW